MATRTLQRYQSILCSFKQLAVGINQGEVNIDKYVRVLHAVVSCVWGWFRDSGFKFDHLAHGEAGRVLWVDKDEGKDLEVRAAGVS